MTTKAKPAKLNPLSLTVVHMFHVRGSSAVTPKGGLYWRAGTCDGRYRATGKTKKATLERIESLARKDRAITGMITYRGVCRPSEMAATLGDLHMQHKEAFKP